MTEQRDVVRRVEAACAGGLSAKMLREALVSIIRSGVGFDAHLFALTDPVTRVGTSPLADVPGLSWPRLPTLVRARYLTHACRWAELVDAVVPSASLLQATGGRPEDSLLWRECQRELGVSDTLITVFADRYGCWGFLDLWRIGGRFEATDVALLASLAGAIAPGLRGALARTFVDPDEQLLPLGPAVVVLGPDLEVRSQTAGAAAALLQLNPPDEPMAPVPAAAYNIGAALVAQEHGVPVGEPWSRVHLGGSRWMTVKADRMGEDIAVSIEPATSAERTDLYARTSGVTPRESEVLHLLALGLDSREIADALVISEHTANDHVKSMLAKTGARTRGVLLARARGTG